MNTPQFIKSPVDGHLNLPSLVYEGVNLKFLFMPLWTPCHFSGVHSWAWNCWIAWQMYVEPPEKLPKRFPKLNHVLFVSNRNGVSVAVPTHQYLAAVVFKVSAVLVGVKCSHCSNRNFPQDFLSALPTTPVFSLCGSA